MYLLSLLDNWFEINALSVIKRLLYLNAYVWIGQKPTEALKGHGRKLCIPSQRLGDNANFYFFFFFFCKEQRAQAFFLDVVDVLVGQFPGNWKLQIWMTI